MTALESLVVVTKKTALEELIARFNTQSQAKFYIEQTARQNPGVTAPSFAEYQEAHDAYQTSLEKLKQSLPRGVKAQIIERAALPNFQFSERDLVVTIGPDGLVINTAKYVSIQPILAFNPDPTRIDGVLTPFHVSEPRWAIDQALRGNLQAKPVSMAKAQLNDGQSLYAVNDLFIGARTHVSARYRIEFGNASENQSSSGLIVSTGAGSTGWLSSVVGGARTLTGQPVKQAPQVGGTPYAFDSAEPFLCFVVREPFVSKTSTAGIVFGWIGSTSKLVMTSHMPENGVIFSDGIEADFIQFNSGSVASITVAERNAHLLQNPNQQPHPTK